MKNILWFSSRSSSLINKYGKYNELKNINGTIQLRWNMINRSINTTNNNKISNSPATLNNNSNSSNNSSSDFNFFKPLKDMEMKKNTNAKELSNRQKFNRIQPPLKLYEKLERLGFGTLRQTKKFKSLNKQKHKKDLLQKESSSPEPTYTV